MARTGQYGTQSPQPLHLRLRMIACRGASKMARSGHMNSQTPQRMQSVVMK